MKSINAVLMLAVLTPSFGLRMQSTSVGKPMLHAPPPRAAVSAANALLLGAPALLSMPMPVMADDGPGFSQASYYTTLALYVFSFPGIYSLVKRSVKSKIVRKTYEVAGPAADGGRPTR